MCGVDGFWGPPDRSLLQAMTDAQRHRGPDDDGYFESDVASLGFRRLSIIDVEHGAQPMATDDGLLHVVYNGEVYNFRELRAELEALGHRFHTRCDTEVVLHAFAEWGPDCFTRFNGMWAVALLDRRGPAPRLVLARDHFGIKPLFYARSGPRVLFASEIKAILQDPAFERRVDEQRMYEYLRYGFFDHDTATFFEGVTAVEAASYVVVDDTGIRAQRYWTPVLDESGSGDPEEFRAVFERAVERRLVADVPVGICLSGGLDSGSIVSVMARLLERHVPDSVSLGERLKTFSALFPGDPIDESDYIQAALDTSHADSTICEPTSQDFVDEMEAWVWHVEEPMISSAPFAMWMVMRLAAQQVKVVLDGEAGDELLGGYQHYPYVFIRDLVRRGRYADAVREAWQLRDIVGPLMRRRLRDGRRNRRVDVAALLNRSFTAGRTAPPDNRSKDDVKLRLLQDFLTWSLPPLLRYEDRNSMAHSLEARLPFLDQELVEHVLRLPVDSIIHRGITRYVLRAALRDVLPDKIYYRRKKIGFTTPEFRWYRARRAALNSLMRSPSFATRPYWNGPAMAEAFREACRGNKEESWIFWRAVNVEIWLRVFFDEAATALDGDSLHAGFIRRGDRAAAQRLGGAAEPILAACAPNRGRHLFMQLPEGVFARVPLRSRLIRAGDHLPAALCDCLDEMSRRGVPPAPGDLILISEKTLAISQRRAFPVDEVHVTKLAGKLSRYVTRTPVGVGLGHPVTMQLALNEAGAPRILAASAAALVTRPFGKRGVFYQVAGERVRAIDGPSKYNLPPYDRWACLSPQEPERAAREIAHTLGDRYGVPMGVAVIDANDLNVDVLGTSAGVDPARVAALVADNPLGQSAERTPFGLVRRLVKVQAPAAERALAATTDPAA